MFTTAVTLVAATIGLAAMISHTNHNRLRRHLERRVRDVADHWAGALG